MHRFFAAVQTYIKFFKKVKKYAIIIVDILTEVRIGRYVKIIEDSAFRCAYSLRKIIIPPSVTFVGNFSIRTAFENSSSNFESLDVFFEPNSRLNYVGFYGISGSRNINLYHCSCRKPDIVYNQFFIVNQLI